MPTQSSAQLKVAAVHDRSSMQASHIFNLRCRSLLASLLFSHLSVQPSTS